jgi:Zn-finger nucleic acid-binding protein
LIGLGVLRRQDISQALITEIWQRVIKLPGVGNRTCPHCDGTMTQISKHIDDHLLTLDICSRCQCIWFDPRELESMPKRELLPLSNKDTELSAEAKVALAKFQVGEMKNTRAELDEAAYASENAFIFLFTVIKNFMSLKWV